MSLKPNSNISKALTQLSEHGGECSTRDFLRMVKTISGDSRYDSLANELQARGLIERRVVLTQKARQEMGENA